MRVLSECNPIISWGASELTKISQCWQAVTPEGVTKSTAEQSSWICFWNRITVFRTRNQCPHIIPQREKAKGFQVGKRCSLEFQLRELSESWNILEYSSLYSSLLSNHETHAICITHLALNYVLLVTLITFVGLFSMLKILAPIGRSWVMFTFCCFCY